MTTRRAAGAAATFTAAALLAVTGCASDDAGDVSELLDEIRAATAQYHDVAAAEAAGYETDGHCVPHMGYHYVNGIHDTADLDALAPNILVYAPDGDGSLRLAAVEYGTFADDAELFGVEFDPPGDPGPPFSTLHAWVWLGNPDGTFAAHNPLVSCD
jgi:hypothetical protein